MEEDFIKVTHKNEEVDGAMCHVIRIYEPLGYEYCKASWPVTPNDDGLDAIWSGVTEARKVAQRFGAKHIGIHSTDTEAFALYNAEMDAHE